MNDSYSRARLRNQRRFRAATEKRCADMRAAKERKRLDSSVDRSDEEWEPPYARKTIIIIDHDSGRPMIRSVVLLRSDRIDQYRAWGNGKISKPMGMSKILASIRRQMPRARAARQ